jgi:hypothetical protein
MKTIAVSGLLAFAGALAAPAAQDSRPAPGAGAPMQLDGNQPLGDLGFRMERIAKLLSQQKTGEVVQASQREALSQIDAMIELLRKKSGS